MKKSKIKFSPILVIILVALMGCPSSKKEQDYSIIELEDSEIDSVYFDSIDEPFESQDTLKFLGVGRGATWRTWRKLHKECMKAAWLRKAFYFGVTSTINLGAIVDKDLTLQRVIDENTFNKKELDLLFNFGSFANCNYSQELTISLDVFVQSEFEFTGDVNPDVSAELKSAISTSSNTKVKIDSWRVNNLIEQNLLDILKDAEESEEKKVRFYESLKDSDNRILTKVVEIKGFTSEIILSEDMSSNLEAKLADGIVASVGNTGMKSQFKYKNKRTIEVTSDGNFYVFGEFKKSKKVD